MADDTLSYIGQKAFIEKNGELLILHDPQMGLDLPGGKIQEGETDLALSLAREVQEETGLIIRVGSPFYTWFFTIPQDSGHRSAGKKIFSVAYRCTYVSGSVVLSTEHDWFKWITKDNYEYYLEKSNFAPAMRAYFHDK